MKFFLDIKLFHILKDTGEKNSEIHCTIAVVYSGVYFTAAIWNRNKTG